MQARVWLVIPTYNEADNIEGILRASAAELDRIAPGTTGSWSSTTARPTAPARSPSGSASSSPRWRSCTAATSRGSARPTWRASPGRCESGAEFVFEMDADFSHDPRYLEPLLDAARDVDLVLGSRYVPGGGVENWGLVRRLISRGGGLYARLILRVDVRDLTGGFKCIRRQVLEAIELDSVSAEGYVFQIEVTYRALLAGFRVREVPIVFADRTAGTSKMSARIAIEAIWLVPRLRRSAAAAIARSGGRRQAVKTP